MINEEKLKNLIGKQDEDLEEEFEFGFYLETKDKFLAGKNVDPKKLTLVFFDFIGEQDILVVKQYDGEIEEYFRMEKEKIIENILLFDQNKGEFYDEDYCVCYSLLGEDFWATLMGDVLMYSSNEENVFKLTEILDKNNIEYHDIHNLTDDIYIQKPLITREKIGRNDPCPCGSGKKYKKCCIDKVN